MIRFLDFNHNCRGQSMVEFALVVPILLLIICGIIDFSRIFNANIIVTGAAREGARSAAVGNNDSVVTNTIQQYAAPINTGGLVISISPATRVTGQLITVTVSNPVPVITPFINVFLGSSFTVRGTAVMRAE